MNKKFKNRLTPHWHNFFNRLTREQIKESYDQLNLKHFHKQEPEYIIIHTVTLGASAIALSILFKQQRKEFIKYHKLWLCL